MNELTFEVVASGNTYKLSDFGLTLTDSLKKAMPSVQSYSVNIPGRNGALDLSEALTGSPVFGDRQITYTIGGLKETGEWIRQISSLANAIHGKRVKVYESDDPGYYWVGRMAVQTSLPSRSARIASFDCILTAEPFKWEIQDSTEDWVWDTFDFDEGIARSYKNVAISGTTSVTVIGSQFNSDVVVKTSAAGMTVTYTQNGESVQISLAKGKNTVYGLMLKEGENTLVFTGTGTVDIIYRGGSL